jgi:hypothetical protein
MVPQVLPFYLPSFWPSIRPSVRPSVLHLPSLRMHADHASSFQHFYLLYFTLLPSFLPFFLPPFVPSFLPSQVAGGGPFCHPLRNATKMERLQTDINNLTGF